MNIDYRFNDADHHYYEPDDCFSRHIESKYRDRTMWIDRSTSGPGRMHVGRERCAFFSVGAADSIGPPGIMKDFLRGASDEGGSPSLSPQNGLAIPEYVDHDARLVQLDAQGIESCLMLPSTGVGIEPQLRKPEHREVLYPSVRAFNRWLQEDWGYGSDGRIYGAPILSLMDLDGAVVELERLLVEGARFAVVTAGPCEGRSPGDPHYDPFWARVQESGINVVYHIGNTPFGEMYSKPWGLRAMPPSHRHSFMEYALAFTERPVVDTVTALIGDNVFGRFPALKILTVEYGSMWVAPMLSKLDQIARLYSKDLWRFGPPPEKPSDLFRKHVWVSPFFEDDVVGLSETVGVDRVLMGSDYPHPEGLASPVEFAEELEGLGEPAVRRIMRDNFAELVA